jgi:hypothetical protein
MHRHILKGRTIHRAARALVRRTTALLAATATLAFAFVGSLPMPAAANDLSDYPCTAGDVEIVGAGIVINEPCSCPPGGKFNANVQFTVRNNTSTGRYCIALHLVPDGVVLTQPMDLVLRDANGSSTAPGKSGGAKYQDTIMFGSIVDFPCNAGEVCFGQSGVVRGKCSPGTCTTISWNTSPGNAACTAADQSPPGGQCRHQQVCVVGFGATLQCTANCTPACGATSTLHACVTAPAMRGPFQLGLAGSDGSTTSQSAFADPSGTTCVDFNVNPTGSPTTTYTLTVTDKNGCTRTAQTSLTVTAVTASITQGTAGCNGVVRFIGSVTGKTGCAYTWKVDGVSLATFLAGGTATDARVATVSGTSGENLDFRCLDNACHTIEVSSSCANGTQTPCVAKATITASQCVTTTSGCTVPK